MDRTKKWLEQRTGSKIHVAQNDMKLSHFQWQFGSRRMIIVLGGLGGRDDYPLIEALNPEKSINTFLTTLLDPNLLGGVQN